MSGTFGAPHRASPPARPAAVLWVSALALVVFLVWSSFAVVAEMVRAPGEVVMADRSLIIQNLEGGIIAELGVTEGDIVQPGDLLVRLSDTQYRAAVDELARDIATLEVRRARLEAEIAGVPNFTLDPELEKLVPDIAASERALLVARLESEETTRSGLARLLADAEEQAELMGSLAARDLIAPIEALNARKAMNEARLRHDEAIVGVLRERAEVYSATLSQFAALRQTRAARQDQLNRTVIRADIAGIVNSVRLGAVGGVVGPGEEILQIVPLGDALYINAKVEPKDIARIRSGQEVTIKLSAYDFMIFGTLKGEVELVSADTFTDPQTQYPAPYYRVRARIDRENMSPRQAEIELRPGMQATVELHTGEKSVMHYLLKPLFRGAEAFSEP